MNFGINMCVGAEFKLIVRKACDDSISCETPYFKNLVLNTGLDRMSVGTWIDRCCVGAGNSTPVSTQTSLDSFIGSSTTMQSVTNNMVTTSPPYYFSRITWRFNTGVATGNLSEVGLGWSNTAMWNRSLIKDINGNPTTITIKSDEYLDVISEVRTYPTESGNGAFSLYDKNDSLVSSHKFIYKPAFGFASNIQPIFNVVKPVDVTFAVFSGDIGAITGLPSGSSSSDRKSVSHTNPSRRSCNAKVVLGLSNANFTHKSLYAEVGGLLQANGTFGYQFQIDPPITVKNNTREMEYNISLTWDRIS